MAPPPVKSQPLHNFSLPHLKWAHKNSSSAPGSSSYHHRSRRRDSPDQHQHCCPDPYAEHESQPTNPRQHTLTGSSFARAAATEENGEAKPWNLRPRKEIVVEASITKTETGGENNDTKTNTTGNGVKSRRLRGLVEGGRQSSGVERKAKRKVWISLSREEIEEDVYALTGGKPARRPKKWPKNVKKQLNVIGLNVYFPDYVWWGLQPTHIGL